MCEPETRIGFSTPERRAITIEFCVLIFDLEGSIALMASLLPTETPATPVEQRECFSISTPANSSTPWRQIVPRSTASFWSYQPRGQTALNVVRPGTN